MLLYEMLILIIFFLLNEFEQLAHPSTKILENIIIVTVQTCQTLRTQFYSIKPMNQAKRVCRSFVCPLQFGFENHKLEKLILTFQYIYYVITSNFV